MQEQSIRKKTNADFPKGTIHTRFISLVGK